MIDVPQRRRMRRHKPAEPVVMPENPAGMRAVEKIGHRRAGEIGYIKFGPWRHDFCRIAADSLPVG
jgi:hypothetical protein